MHPIIGISVVSSVFVLAILVLVYSIFKPLFHPNHLFVVIFEKDRRVSRYFLQPKNGTIIFKKEKQKYQIDPTRIHQTGRWNVNTIYFLRDRSEAIDIPNMKVTGVKSATDHHEATENHVAADFFHALTENYVSPVTSLLIIVVVLVIGFGVIYWKFNEKLNTANELQMKIGIAVGAIEPAPEVISE